MDGIYSDMYYVEDHINLKDKKIVLFFGGFPSPGGKNLATFFFAELGYLVIHPFFLGTFDSDGDFTPRSPENTLEKFIKVIKGKEILNAKTAKSVAISGVVEIAAAHSFGCHVLLNSSDILSTEIKLMVLFSPVIGFGKKYGSNANPFDQIDYVQRARPKTYRIPSKERWYDFFKAEIESELNNKIKNLGHFKSLFVVGEKDSNFEIDVISDLINSAKIESAKMYIVKDAKHGVESLLNKGTKKRILQTLESL